LTGPHDTLLSPLSVLVELVADYVNQLCFIRYVWFLELSN